MIAWAYDLLRRATPVPLRSWLKRRPWLMPLLRATVGNAAYSTSYYEDIERIEGPSVEIIARWISSELTPTRVIDVGCGPGHLMAALREHGISVYGVDISEAALLRARSRGLHVEAFDLTDCSSYLPAPYDLAVSCEVAEHLEGRFAGTFVRHLTRAAPVVYLTAAEADPTVGPGLYHYNEQPNPYWIRLFAGYGFELDRQSTEAARISLAGSGVISYLARPMIFRGICLPRE